MWAIRLVDSARNRVNQRRQRHQTFQQERRDPRVASIQIIDAETPSPEEPSSSEEIRMPLLFNLCRRWAWPAVEFRCQSHPHEADVQDERGDTCLHWAVFGNPPLSAVEAILTASPDLASVANRHGLLPLHGKCVIYVPFCVRYFEVLQRHRCAHSVEIFFALKWLQCIELQETLSEFWFKLTPKQPAFVHITRSRCHYISCVRPEPQLTAFVQF